MKNILSFFVLICLAINSTTVYSESEPFENEMSTQAGFIFNADFFEIRLFQEIEMDTSFNFNFQPLTWSLSIKPFEVLSFHLGQISYSGIWSRFNNPAPSSIGAIKNAYSVQQRVITSLPSTKSSKTPSASLELNLVFLKVNVISSMFPLTEPFAGMGLAIPFSTKNKSISGSLNSSWQMVSLQSKESTSWFMEEQYFRKNYFHSGIQEVSVKFPNNVVLFSLGASQSPFDKPSGFLRFEHSLIYNPILINSHIFICDLDYLGHKGTFLHDTIQVSFNPQLRLNYYSGVLRSFIIGVTGNAELQNDKKIPQSYSWITSFEGAANIKLLFLSFTNSVSFSSLQLVKSINRFNLYQTEESELSIQSKINYYPWYLSTFARNWSFQGIYKKPFYHQSNKGTLQTKASLRIELPLQFTKKTEIFFSNECMFNLEEIRSIPKIDLLTKAFLEIDSDTSNRSFSFKAQIEVQLHHNGIEKIKSELSTVIKL